MTENLRTILRCTGVALVVIAALVLVPAAAEAQHRTGLSLSKDCPTDPVDQGATATCTFILTNLDTQHGVEGLQVTNEFPFPGGTVTAGVCLRDGLPVTTLGVAGSATDSCAGSFDEVAPFSCASTTQTLTDEVRGQGTDCGPQCGVVDAGDPFEGLPATGSTTNVIRVNPLVCPADTDCVDNECVVGTGCTTNNIADSTPCGTDTDGNECTAPGCFGGVCVQTHIPVADSTPCGTDADPTDCSTPGCFGGACVQTHVPVADSTPCGTDADTTDCSTPGCFGGACVQTHVPVADSTPCGTDADQTDCATPGCVAGACSQTHIPVADSTPCGTDSDTTDCFTPGCVAGACSQTHTQVAASTPCGTDTDGLDCTIPGCDAAGVCNQTHIDECVVEEICRTPGFFGTHGGDEKEEKSQNITQALLDAFNLANPGDPLTICGRDITNTDVGSVNSALEAICVSPKGNSLLQLGRQLTAAALNCILSSSTGDPTDPAQCPPDEGLVGPVCEGVSIEAIFDACNAACAAGDVVAEDVDLGGTAPVDVNCIAALDCFNNGLGIDPETGECTGVPTGCHENELEGGCFSFVPPGAAGSPDACNQARKNDVVILLP